MGTNEYTEYDLSDNNQYHLVQAGKGRRFANYIIDRIVFYLLFLILASVLAEMNIVITLQIDMESTDFAFVSLLIYVFVYALFMSTLEFLLKGKSIGKLFTGTRAVREDGSHLELKDAILRGLCRLIPFNVFSALSNICYPWHDSLSKTYVIDEKRSQYPG